MKERKKQIKFTDIPPLKIDSLFAHDYVELSQKIDKARKDSVSIVRDKALSNKQKLKELNKIDQNEFGSILVQIGQPRKQEDYKTLVKLFNNIAELTLEIGHIKRAIKDHQDQTSKPNTTTQNKDFNNSDADYLKSYTDSAVCYQHVITILNKHLKGVPGSYRDLGIDNPYKKLDQIQKFIVKSVSSNKSVSEELPEISTQKDIDILAHREQLTKLREQTKEDIKLIDKTKGRNHEYIENSRKTFEHVTEGMQNYLASIYEYAENIVGKPPCSYSVMGMGSMALKQITPYSDLEFAIITDDEKYKYHHDSKVRDYFRNLSHYAHFMVICLGETVIPASKYKSAGQREDTGYLVPRAVNFDLGGKTPLGRIDKDKPYELIKTIEYMMQYVRNEEGRAEHIDKNLPYILEKVSHVYGDKSLTTEYQGEVKKFLFTLIEEDGKLIMPCEVRAKKYRKENTRLQSLQCTLSH